MKPYLNIVFFASFLFLFYECNNDDEPENTGEEYIKIYYTHQDSENKQLASDDDTIVANVGDTLFVSVEITEEEDAGFSSVQVFVTDNLKTEEVGDYTYRCIASEAGIAFISAYAENSYLLLPDLTDNIYVNITAPSYLLLIIEEPSFVIDVEDEGLKTKIEAELEESYAPDFYNFYTLTCNTANSGKLQLVTAGNDTISGIFSSSDVFGLRDITMSYNNSTYSFTLESQKENSGYYYLKQDITEEFRTEYPTEIINEVSITSLAIINKE